MNWVVVYERTNRNWSAYVPDLPGCIATGDTREEVEQLIREGIGYYLEELRNQNEPIPQPGAWTGLVEVA